MAYSKKSEVEVEGKRFYRIEILEYVGDSEQHIDHSFVFGYFYKTDMGKPIHRAFQVTGHGDCLDPNCFIKREKKGIYLLRWRGMDETQYQVITTVSDL